MSVVGSSQKTAAREGLISKAYRFGQKCTENYLEDKRFSFSKFSNFEKNAKMTSRKIIFAGGFS